MLSIDIDIIETSIKTKLEVIRCSIREESQTSQA